MKKLLLFAVAISIFHVSSAQIIKGNWLLGGNLAYSYSKPEESTASINTSSEMDVAVNAGYFFVNKFATGIRLNTLISKYKMLYSDGSSSSLLHRSLGLGPFLRYYMLAPEKKVNVFADAGLSYSFSSTASRRVYRKFRTSSFGAGAGLFINQTLGVEGLLSFDHYSYVGASYHVNSLQFKLGLQAHL
jgi:hypothetical protein